MIRAGRLRRRATFERQTEIENEFGERQDVWQPFAIRRASVEPIVGKEYMTQSGEHSEVTTRLRCRYDDVVGGVQPKDRIEVDGETFDVISVMDIRELRRELVIMAKRHG